MRMPTAPASQPKVRVVSQHRGRRRGRARHEVEKLNPSENYFPPAGLCCPFFDITRPTPPACAPSCLLTTDLFARAEA